MGNSIASLVKFSALRPPMKITPGKHPEHHHRCLCLSTSKLPSPIILVANLESRMNAVQVNIAPENLAVTFQREKALSLASVSEYVSFIKFSGL